jgi:hypothetical protein
MILILYANDSGKLMTIGDDLVTLNRDGSVIFGKNYKPDIAAQCFWESLGFNNFIKSKGIITRDKI